MNGKISIFLGFFLFLAVSALPRISLGVEQVDPNPNEAVYREVRDSGRDREVEDQGIFTVGEVVVTDRRFGTVEQAGTASIVTGEELERRGETTLDQALFLIPGVQSYTHTKGYQRLRLRGFDQGKVAILVDGIPLHDVYSTDTDLSSIPMAGVSRIAVIRGVSSALYGTEGAAGAINVVTRRPYKPLSQASVEVGSYNNSSYTLSHGMPVGDFYYWVSGSIITSGGFAPSSSLDQAARRRWFDRLIPYQLYGKTFDQVLFPAKDQYLNHRGLLDHQEMNKYSASGKVGWQVLPSLELGLSAGFFFQEGQTNTYEAGCFSDYNLAEEKWRVNRRPWFGDEVESTKDFALRNRAFVLPEFYRITLAPYLQGEWRGFSLKLATFFTLTHAEQEGYASTDHSYSKDQASIFTDRRNDPWEPFADLKSYGSLGFRLVPSYRFSRTHRLTGSLHWRYDSLLQQDRALSPALSPTIIERMGTAAYPVNDLAAHYLSLALEDELRPIRSLSLSAGVSYDMQLVSRFRSRGGADYGEVYIVRDEALLLGTRDALNPVASAVWDPIKHVLRFRLAGSMKVVFPNLSEYSRITSAELDQDLRPERSYNLSSGFEVFLPWRLASLRADYFLSVMDDRIAKINKDEPPVNIDRLTAQGIETILTVQAPTLWGLVKIRGSAAYTWVVSRNLDDSNEEQVNMGDWVEGVPEHQVTLDLVLDFVQGTSFGFWARYLRGARQYVMAAAPEEYAPYSTDYFTTVRLHDPLMLNARISHSFLDYFEVDFTVKNILDDYEQDPFNPGPGRMFLGGLKVSL